MARKVLYFVAAILISGCSYTADAGAFDGRYSYPPGAYLPVAVGPYGQPILAAPLYFGGVPVTFHAVDDGVWELIDPNGYVVGYAYIDGIDRLRITDLGGNTLYLLRYDTAGYFHAFDPYGSYLTYYAHGHLAHHFHINRHHFHTPFLRFGAKARHRFRLRADKHRKARLGKRAHHRHKKHAAHPRKGGKLKKHRRHKKGSRHALKGRPGGGEFEGRHPHRKKAHRGPDRHEKGSRWKLVRRSGVDPAPVDPTPRGLNTGGAAFNNDFAFKDQVERGARAPRHGPRAGAFHPRGDQRFDRAPQEIAPAVSETQRAARQSRQMRRQTRRALSSPRPSTSQPQANASTEPRSEQRERSYRSQRNRPMRHRAGPRDSYRRR